MKRSIKLLFSIFILSFFTFFSCHAKYSDSEFANIVLKAQEGVFSPLLPLTTKKMKRLIQTDEASLVCLGLYLYQGEMEEDAKKMFRFASINASKPFSTLAKEKLFYISSDEEKVFLLDEEIEELVALQKESVKEPKEQASIEKKLEDLKNKKREHLFFAGKWEELEDDVPSLFANRAMTSKVLLTYQLFCDEEETDLEEFHSTMNMRILVFEKKYDKAYLEAKKLMEASPVSILHTKYIFYDLLRSMFFSSNNYAEKAELLRKFLAKNDKYISKGNRTNIEYLAYLYLARLYEKSGSANRKLSLEYYNRAIKIAPSPYDFDDSNWFKLNLELKTDFPTFLKDFALSIPKWSSHAWYEDLVSKVVTDRVAKRQFTVLKQFYEIIKKTNLEDQKAKLKYILARQGLIGGKKKDAIYREIYRGEHNLIYYTLLSAYHLDLPMEDVLYKKKVKREENVLYSSQDAKKILDSYIKYGLHSHIYREAIRIYPTITVEEASKFSKELQLKEFFPDSINLVQFAINSEGSSFNAEHLRSVYPRPFYKEVSKWAKEYNVSEYIMYALIRSESFFRPKVASHAGAMGLAQLMPKTAREIAKSLKIKNYDILDCDDNIHFGTYYLSNMIKRFDGKIMPGMCAYNAGPTAVSRWLKNNTIEKEDIFVEGIPYDETRNYGKKLLSTACMYASLYYNKTSRQVIEEIYRDIGR